MDIKGKSAGGKRLFSISISVKEGEQEEFSAGLSRGPPAGPGIPSCVNDLTFDSALRLLVVGCTREGGDQPHASGSVIKPGA
jgi:hypothetical protein